MDQVTLFGCVFVNLAAGAGLTGSKMARRTGKVDEFEFRAIGENHNQGVSFSSFFFIGQFDFLVDIFNLQPLMC